MLAQQIATTFGSICRNAAQCRQFCGTAYSLCEGGPSGSMLALNSHAPIATVTSKMNNPNAARRIAQPTVASCGSRGCSTDKPEALGDVICILPQYAMRSPQATLIDASEVRTTPAHPQLKRFRAIFPSRPIISGRAPMNGLRTRAASRLSSHAGQPDGPLVARMRQQPIERYLAHTAPKNGDCCQWHD